MTPGDRAPANPPEALEDRKPLPFLGMVLLLLAGFVVRMIDPDMGNALVASAVAWLLVASAILHWRSAGRDDRKRSTTYTKLHGGSLSQSKRHLDEHEKEHGCQLGISAADVNELSESSSPGTLWSPAAVPATIPAWPSRESEQLHSSVLLARPEPGKGT